MNRSKSLIFFLIPFLVSIGCAPYVTVKRTVPAKFHITGIKKIVFTPFAYQMTYHEKGSTIIPEILEEAVSKNGFFEDTSFKSLPLKIDETFSTNRLVKIGREARADAVISGKVMAFQATDERKEIPVEEVVNGKKVTYYETDIARLAEVSFYADLIDVRSRNILDHQYFSKIGEERAKGEGIKKLTGEEKMLRGVTQKLAADIVNALTPHDVTEKIPFENEKACKEGVKAAKKGNWDSAISSWNDLLIQDPNLACAHYNIGLYNEFMKKYPEALKSYIKAEEQNPEDPLYIKAVKRTENTIKGEKIVERQIKGRK